MMRPLALDLFCGAGGASMGLYRAGFDVIGVDIKNQRRYPFSFIRGDALTPPVDLARFALIWASPPCQAHSVGNLAARRKGYVVHPDLIAATRALLSSVDTLTVIENVPGAPIRVDLALDGTMFPGLRVIKRRHFELNFPAPFALGFDASGHCKYRGWSEIRAQGRAQRQPNYVEYLLANRAEAVRRAMGCEWIIGKQELANAIPPAFSEFIARAALEQLQNRKAA